VGLRTGKEGDDRKWGEKGKGGKRQDRDQQGDDKKRENKTIVYVCSVQCALKIFILFLF